MNRHWIDIISGCLIELHHPGHVHYTWFQMVGVLQTQQDKWLVGQKEWANQRYKLMVSRIWSTRLVCRHRKHCFAKAKKERFVLKDWEQAQVRLNWAQRFFFNPFLSSFLIALESHFDWKRERAFVFCCLGTRDCPFFYQSSHWDQGTLGGLRPSYVFGSPTTAVYTRTGTKWVGHRCLGMFKQVGSRERVRVSFPLPCVVLVIFSLPSLLSHLLLHWAISMEA